MKLAVCDKDNTTRRAIARLAEGFFRNRAMECTILIFRSGESLLHDSNTFDFVFLDMEISVADNVDVTNAIRRRNPQCQIIFLADRERYRDYSYQVHAFDYLSKPVTREKIHYSLSEALRYRGYEKGAPLFFFKTTTGNIVVEADKLYYLEYKNRRLHIVCEGGQYVSAAYHLKQVYG